MQIQSDDFEAALRGQADARTKILFGTTDQNWELKNTIRVSASASVEALAREFKIRRNEILPIVKRFDSHVGDDFLSERIEKRIELSAKSDTPWQFTYTLRGGWRQTRHFLNAARDFGDNDLLLTTIAARQVASLDAGCTMQEIVSDSQVLEHDALWARNTVQQLESQRLLLVGETIRCLHFRSAAAIIEVSLGDVAPDRAYKLIAIIQGIVSASDVPLQGISWLLSIIRAYRQRILTDEIKAAVLTRCFNAHTHIERRDACFVLANLLGWKGKTGAELLAGFSQQLRTWLVEANCEDVYGIACLVNNLHNNNKQLCQQFLKDVAPHSIAEKLPGIECKDGYDWGYFLGRLRCGCSQEWSDSFASSIERDSIRNYIDRFDSTKLAQLSEFILGIAAFDFDFGLKCLERAVPIYRAEFTRDALDTYGNMQDLKYRALGNPLFKKPNPSDRQRFIVKTMFEGIDPPTIVEQILTCPFGDWESYARLLEWVGRMHPAKIRQIIGVMDWNRLDSVIGDKWKTPPRELRLLLGSMRTNRDGEPIRTWVEKHAGQIEVIDPILAGISPRAAIIIIGNGKYVALGSHNRSDWKLQAWALARIATEDKDTAIKVIQQNQSHFAKGLAELSDPRELTKLLELIEELNNTCIAQVVDTLEPDEVSENWRKSLTDPRKDERYAVRKVLRKIAAVGHDSIHKLAESMLRSIRYHATNR